MLIKDNNNRNNSHHVQATMKAINDACRRRGGTYSSYSCKTVSWDDVSRGGGGFSCVGNNITDTFLTSKNGERLFTVRPDNWFEKLGTVDASEVAVITGNHHPTTTAEGLKPKTLRDVLKTMGEIGSYAGLSPSWDASKYDLDSKCSIRFQTTFLPVQQQQQQQQQTPFPVAGGRETIEFTTEAVNYQTRSKDDPKNLVLLCTTQGIAVQADEGGKSRLFHHTVQQQQQQSHGTTIHRHWLEAERTNHAVGGPQVETQAERDDAIARGKAIASVIGPRALGTRFNVLMTIQLPLQQQKPPPMVVYASPAFGGCAPSAFGACAPTSYSLPMTQAQPPIFLCSQSGFGLPPWKRRLAAVRPSPNSGTSNAARVSVGSQHDVWTGLHGRARSPVRHPSEHITITVVLYNIVVGGIPTEADVVAAIDDLEQLYTACRTVARTSSTYANTNNNIINIFPMPTKLPSNVQSFNTFPTPLPPQPTATTTTTTTAFTPFKNVPATILQQVKNMPLNHESYLYVHNLGLHNLSNPQASIPLLKESWGLFCLANEMFTQLYERSCPTCHYNLACVCSRTGRVDESLRWLRLAVVGGWKDLAHMQVDTDLDCVRTNRPIHFQGVVQLGTMASSWAA